MPNRKLQSILTTERILDWEHFDELPKDIIIDQNVTYGKGGRRLEEWEWSITIFHDEDDEGFDHTMYVMPPIMSRIMNSYERSVKERTKLEIRNVLGC